MNMILAIAAGGAIGALGRHFFAHWVSKTLMTGAFPVGVLACNIIGAFIMGALIELSALHWNISQEMRGFLAVGVLGSFTTFSTFALETVMLLQKGQMVMGAGYVLASVSGAILALVAAMYLVRQF